MNSAITLEIRKLKKSSGLVSVQLTVGFSQHNPQEFSRKAKYRINQEVEM